MSILEELIGKKLEKVQRVHDYFQLYFDDGAIVNINNEYKYFDDSDNRIESMKDATLNRVIETNETLAFFSQRLRN